MVKPTPIWRNRRMLYPQQGDPPCTLANTVNMLRNDKSLEGLFAFDQMRQQPVMMKVDPGPMSDIKLLMMQEMLQHKRLVKLGIDTTDAAIHLVAQDHPFHPIRDHLDKVSWDGTPRTGSFLPTYFGTVDDEYHRTVGSCFLVGMVKRIYEPGCKMDYMLVLEGPQGSLKSTACRILGGEYFSDTLPDPAQDPVRFSMHLRGKWVIEISELSAFSRAEKNRLKSILTTQQERYTPKFGRVEVVEPRQCIFVGTTNDDRYLRDETGARRFWPAKCGVIDIEALERDRDQLLAEALDALRHGAQAFPDPDFEEKYIQPVQSERYEHDVWEDTIRSYYAMNPVVYTSLMNIAQNALGFDKDCKVTRTDQLRLMACLKRIGWTSGKRKGTIRPWFMPGTEKPL